MGDGIDDGLAHNVGRHLIGDRCLSAFGARTDGEVDLGEDEIDSLVHELEGGALVNLIEGNGLGDLRAVKAGALDLGGDDETLGRVREEHHGGVGGPAIFEQMEVLQYEGGLGVFGEGEPTGAAGDADEETDFLGVEIVKLGLCTKSRIEGTGADEFPIFEVEDERGVNPVMSSDGLSKRRRINWASACWMSACMGGWRT